ncbi:TFIIB-type zinc ribbon-containing protein, partial [Halosegnis rubeus]
MSNSQIRTYRGTETETTDENENENENEQESELTCPECGGSLATDTEHGETVCEDCGLVIEEDSIDRGPEWRAF